MMQARQIDVQGAPVRLWSGGEGPALLLLQGGMTDAEMHWRPIWDRLSERFTVYAPDLPGFGGSARLKRPDYPRLVGWIDALRSEIGAERLTVAGNSFGASLARLYAAAHPEQTERLILLNGGSIFRRIPLRGRLVLASPVGGWIMARRARKGFGRDTVERMFAEPAAADPALLDRCAASNEIFHILRHCSAGPEPDSAWTDAPTLVIWGEADRHVDMGVGRIHAQHAPNGTFKAIPGAGHLPQLEQPEATAQAIFDFCGTI
ncbi:alpha/beta hydrolase [Phenylobacterium sp.]|uniref:alpha/beta fold hydrolase n=1 Tax=Phenylobacterium sp. TaxID=1871053 RepID=UPI0025F1870C|nr:alpha/beta hydrolase [Phenylobacterium sp.]